MEWANYLSAYSIIFEKRSTEKGQVIASLMNDFPVEDIPFDDDKPVTIPSTEHQINATEAGEAHQREERDV